MMTLPKICAVLGIVVTALSTTAMADAYHHIDELALGIQKKSKELICEARHFRHTPEYVHLVRGSSDVLVSAVHVRGLALRRACPSELEVKVAQLHAKFHQLKCVFDRVEHIVAHGYGQIHGHTAHVKALLCSIDECIHHLQDHVRCLRAPHRPVVLRRPAIHTAPGPFYSAPRIDPWDRHRSFGYQTDRDLHHHYINRSRGRSISIGGGSTRFTFRF